MAATASAPPSSWSSSPSTVARAAHPASSSSSSSSWLRRARVYALYVDLFAGTFESLIERLDYVAELGADTLWLLPVLSSPMLDGGYDVDSFERLRPSLFREPDADPAEHARVFDRLLAECRRRGMHVIMDVTPNHVSVSHEWFRRASELEDPEYRPYFMWSSTGAEFASLPLIFDGLETSVWQREKGPRGQFYFHRFFWHQADLNYAHAPVLRDVTLAFARLAARGVDGFRLDSAGLLWKAEHTSCEGLPQTHAILRFLRAALTCVRPEIALLAEVCVPAAELAPFFGSAPHGDECHACFHFPLMPRVFLALARERAAHVRRALLSMPDIPDQCQLVTFLRVHDELTLQHLGDAERRALVTAYLRDRKWSFRENVHGESAGISARLGDLLQNDARRVALAFSIATSVQGAPLILYGDETAQPNSDAFFDEMFAHSGIADSRYRCRGRMDWSRGDAARAAADVPVASAADERDTSTSAGAAAVWRALRSMLRAHGRYECLCAHDALRPAELLHLRSREHDARPAHELSSVLADDHDCDPAACGCDPAVLAFVKRSPSAGVGAPALLCVHNLSASPRAVLLPPAWRTAARAAASGDALGRALDVAPAGDDGGVLLSLDAFAYAWIESAESP